MVIAIAMLTLPFWEGFKQTDGVKGIRDPIHDFMCTHLNGAGETRTCQAYGRDETRSKAPNDVRPGGTGAARDRS
eukprot:SAG11_NODE_21181_length_430_cov_0.779456_1_plen_74_part_10